MPPWKRHKFEVAGAGEAARAPPPAGQGQGGGGGGGGRPWREGSLLGRVGRLFRSKRRKVRVSREAPTYAALYLGHAATLQAKGEGCTEAAVGRIWAKSQAGRRGTAVKLSVGPHGLRLAPGAAAASASTPPPPGHLYLLARVTYCAADARLPRLFAWVYRHEGRHKAELLRCHAALLARARHARALALLLRQAAAAALADFRRLKKRADARRRRPPLALPPGGDGEDADDDDDEAPPTPPGRTKTTTTAPVEAPRARGGAPRLPAIHEDWLGEERERRGAAGRLARDLGRLAIRDGRAPPAPASA